MAVIDSGSWQVEFGGGKMHVRGDGRTPPAPWQPDTPAPSTCTVPRRAFRGELYAADLRERSTLRLETRSGALGREATCYYPAMSDWSALSESELVANILNRAHARGLRLRSDPVELDPTGWDFYVLHAVAEDGGRWIVRVPRRPEVAKTIGPEAKLLALVRGHVPVPVPDWQIQAHDLVAYPRLEGLPAASEDVVTRQLHWRINREDPAEEYVEMLGRCMAALHAISVSDAAVIGIAVHSPGEIRTEFSKKLERARHEIGMHKTWRERGEQWLENDKLWPDHSVLIHGDLHPGHTLVDLQGRIVGLLDWTDAEVGDPGQEFIEASRKFQPALLDRLLEAYARYGGRTWDGLRQHIFEGIAFAPMFLGLLGLDNDQKLYVEKARARLSEDAQISPS